MARRWVSSAKIRSRRWRRRSRKWGDDQMVVIIGGGVIIEQEGVEIKAEVEWVQRRRRRRRRRSHGV